LKYPSSQPLSWGASTFALPTYTLSVTARDANTDDYR